MARIRTIKPEFPQSESMGRISRDARLLFVQMWTLSDDSGRLRGNSRMLASLLFPYDDDASGLIPTWLDELTRERCIERYEVDGQSYIQILNWLNHQKIDKPSASKIPAFDESSRIVAKPREPSSEEGIKDQGREKKGTPTPCAAVASRFDEFWAAWPQHPRKRDRKACAAKWKARRLDAIADVILANVKALEQTDEWKRGFIPLPETYLNNDRWDDEVIHAEKVAVDAATGEVKEWHETASGITKRGASLGIFQDEGEFFPTFKARVYAAAGHVPVRSH